MSKLLRSFSSVITPDQHRELKRQKDSIVSLVTRPWTGQLRNHISIPSRDKRFFSSPKCSDQPVQPPTSYLEGNRGLYLGKSLPLTSILCLVLFGFISNSHKSFRVSVNLSHNFVPSPKLFLLPISGKIYPISVITFTTAYLLFVALACHHYKETLAKFLQQGSQGSASVSRVVPSLSTAN